MVVDRTGLTVSYDVDLTFAAAQAPGLNAAAVFSAVEEQLGLELSSTTPPVDFLVIDSIDHPSGN